MTSVYAFLEELAELMKKYKIERICSLNVYCEKQDVTVQKYPISVDFEELTTETINEKIKGGKHEKRTE